LSIKLLTGITLLFDTIIYICFGFPLGYCGCYNWNFQYSQTIALPCIFIGW